MSTESAYPGTTCTSCWRALATRAAGAPGQRATWFPLLVLAAVTFASIPVLRYGHVTLTCRAVPPAGKSAASIPARRSSTGRSPSCWPTSRSRPSTSTDRARGIGTRVRPYVTAGIIIAVVLTGASLWAAHHPPACSYAPGLHGPQSWGLFFRLASPSGAIGLALLVLAWAERNRALLVFTLGYLVIVLVPITFGWVIPPVPPSPWAFLPRVVVQGSVLLLGGIGFALAQRPAGCRRDQPSRERARRRRPSAGAARHPYHRSRGTAGGVQLPALQPGADRGQPLPAPRCAGNAGLITIEKGYAGNAPHLDHPHQSRPRRSRRGGHPPEAPDQPDRTHRDSAELTGHARDGWSAGRGAVRSCFQVMITRGPLRGQR